MKIKTIYPLLALPLFSAGLFADTYSFTGNWTNISVPNDWTLNGSPAEQLPGASDDVIFGASTDSYGTDHWVKFTLTSGVNYVFEVNNLTAYGNTRFVPQDGNRDTSVGDLPAQRADFLAKAPIMIVHGDLATDGDDVCFGRGYGDDRGCGIKSMSVEGDMFLSGQTRFNYASDTYSTTNPALRVQGQVKLQTSELNPSAHTRWALDFSGEVATYQKIGGIDTGSTVASIVNGNEWNGKTTLELTQADTGKYAGTFQGGTFVGFIGEFGQDGEGIEIVMNDTSNGGNKQTFKLSSVYMDSADKKELVDVTVLAGLIDISTNETGMLGTLKLAGGGTFGVADGGSAIFERDVEWKSGAKIELTVDTDDLASDLIVARNLVFDSDDSENAAYEIIFDFIGIGDPASLTDLTVFELTNSTVDQSMLYKLVGVSKDGQWQAVFDLDNGNVVVSSFVAVPEPATIAAIFGALALAFAAYRRRR